MIYLIKPRGNLAFNLIDVLIPPAPATIINYSKYLDFEKYLYEPLWEGRNWSHCRAWRAAVLPYWLKPHTVIVEMQYKTMPHICYIFGQQDNGFWYLSESAKKIIESCDQFQHQFWPVAMIDQDHNSVVQEQYYALNIRRRLQVESIGKSARISDEMWSCFNGYHDKKIIATIENTPLKEIMEKQPIWRHKSALEEVTGESDQFFINSHLLALFQQKLPGSFPDQAETPDTVSDGTRPPLLLLEARSTWIE